MELDNIIKLIETVSNSNITSFQYKEGDVSLTLEIKQNTLVEGPDSTKSIVSTVREELPPVKEEKHLLSIVSPIVGTFYAAKSEGSEPYVKVGDKIKKGQVVGIIEAMKLMNEIESEYDGIVEEILVKNKEMVEYGKVLMRIKPL